MQEERCTRISGNWILPPIWLKEKTKTGLTGNELLQHEEFPRKKKITFDT